MTETSRETGPGRKHREGVKMGKAKIIVWQVREFRVVGRHLPSMRRGHRVIRTELILCARLGSDHFLRTCIAFDPHNKYII